MGQSEGDLEQPSGWSCIAENKSNTAVAEAAAEQPRSSAAPESLWSSIVSSTFGVFESNPAVAGASTLGYWTMAMRRAVGSNTTMRRLRSCILGLTGTNTVASSGTLWFLGLCYKMPFNSENDSVATQVFAEFLHDFSSRIWITYRRGFVALEESKLTSDVGWGCMIRSGQMLLAQALVCHYLGRSWRRELKQPHAQEYLEILKRFADAPASTCPFSIHNLIDAGRPYGLCAGTWLGPFALCRSIEALACIDREHCRSGETQPVFPMAICVVSGGADDDRGGAPVLYVDDVADLCSGWQYNSVKWAPLLVLVPLVLGVAKVNPRYIPSLRKTFCFPQSVGIVGGKPKASTYLVGFQENQVLYLDPHELQQCNPLNSYGVTGPFLSFRLLLPESRGLL
ncbi:hypothetical protein O6H91_03G069300 [Diphasiastrum complanatum]|uniref:Uncharacterized protein n=1 Tax=Diphasiastrum complanatum TaxID=34168 RepID=A0ACC2E7H2_DIPCM|nr:hypothetical protein O6H91_03G069300 [Diphasiastrum complanatum]